MSRDLNIEECIFDDGESPLKESKNITLSDCIFRWKYPLWYGENINLSNCTLFAMARAGIWYTKNITLSDCVVEAPKNFRRCQNLTLNNVSLPDAAETLWSCKDVVLNNVTAKGQYFAQNCENVEADHLTLIGDYCFDGAKNIVIRNSKLLAKDSFWNSENVTVYDSFISGEYLGWNSKNLTLINCTIESLQGFCYIENLKLVNCRLINTTLCFEYCTVEADIIGKIDSVKNPYGGTIVCDGIDELIMEESKVDVNKTKIVIRANK